ncbi:MAG: RNA-binding protein [Peptoniphilaceae bacterium]|nr:RNA-binding protein [Peptoniphilaceae bacterium]MDY6018671.1 RNA-binding protein [Anaerococcus sp.]
MIIIKDLKIKRFSKNRAYLATSLGEAAIDKKEVKNLKQGDKIKAYLFFDRYDNLKATKNIGMTVDNIYSLKASEIRKKGVDFLTEDGKKLFMPFSEKTYRINKDMIYPVALKIDDNNLLYLTSKIRNLLSYDHNYKENDLVEGRIYSINKAVGAFIAIENKYDSLMRMTELRGVHIEGELVKARVKEVKDDGKLELTLRKRSYLEIDSDSKLILDYLEDNGGFVMLGDKSSPESIFRIFKLSKSSFKRAIGRLYKNNKIKIYNNKIVLKER